LLLDLADQGNHPREDVDQDQHAADRQGQECDRRIDETAQQQDRSRPEPHLPVGHPGHGLDLQGRHLVGRLLQTLAVAFGGAIAARDPEPLQVLVELARLHPPAGGQQVPALEDPTRTVPQQEEQGAGRSQRQESEAGRQRGGHPQVDQGQQGLAAQPGDQAHGLVGAPQVHRGGVQHLAGPDGQQGLPTGFLEGPEETGLGAAREGLGQARPLDGLEA